MFGGNLGASAITNDNAQAVVINPVHGTRSGLIHFQNTCLTVAESKSMQARNAGGNVFVDNLTTENKRASGGVVCQLRVSVFSEINHVEVADCSGAGCYAIENDAAPASAILAIDIGFGDLRTSHQSGRSYNWNPASLPSVTQSAGIFNAHLYGQTDIARRLFSPVAVQFQNLAQQTASKWTWCCSKCTITVMSPPRMGPIMLDKFPPVNTSRQACAILLDLTRILSVGDEYLFGVWARSQTANGFATGTPGIFQLNGDGTDRAILAATGRGIVYLKTYSTNGWSWYSGICKIATAARKPGCNSMALSTAPTLPNTTLQ